MKSSRPKHAKKQAGFSIVEMLIAIAVIAIVAAIAIPNIAGITESASTAASQRNAQNLASLSSAARAAGYTNEPGSEGQWITNLISGISVTNFAGQIFGPFKADGLPTNSSSYSRYLSLRTNGTLTVLAYDLTGSSTP